MQLESGRNHNGGSNERLFDGVGGPYATAYPSHQGDRKEDTEQGIPLDQIHVRDDVYVDALSGRDALERIVV